jgi:hypothetical protein
MKLIKMLCEEENDLKQLESLLREKCEKYIKRHASDDYFLLRGIKDLHENFGVQKTHDDRRPRDSYIGAHKAFDKYFAKKFGIKFRSENIAFCYSSFARKLAPTDYGDTYFVIPCGDYSICWSPFVTDLYDYADPSRINPYDLIPKVFEDSRKKADIDKLLSCVSLTLDQFEQLESAQEFVIQLYVKHIYAQSGNDRKTDLTELADTFKIKSIEQITESQIENVFDMIVDSFEYRSGDFDLSTVYRSELMVHCKEYVYVDHSKLSLVKKAINNILGE